MTSTALELLLSLPWAIGEGAQRHRHGVATAALEDGDRPVVAEGALVVQPSERPPAVVDAFLREYDCDVTVEVDEDVGDVVLLELRPHRWLMGVDLPVLPDARS